MKKLLKSEICGPWTVHGMHWLVENCLTSQTLRLLFKHSSHNSKIYFKTHEKKKKKNANADTGPKRTQ